MSRPLSLRVELRRQATRPRTRWTYLILLGLPLLVVAAFTLGDDRAVKETFAAGVSVHRKAG